MDQRAWFATHHTFLELECHSFIAINITYSIAGEEITRLDVYAYADLIAFNLYI